MSKFKRGDIVRTTQEIEISPLFASDAAELKSGLPAGWAPEPPVVLEYPSERCRRLQHRPNALVVRARHGYTGGNCERLIA